MLQNWNSRTQITIFYFKFKQLIDVFPLILHLVVYLLADMLVG